MYMAFSTIMYGRSVVISEINKDSPSTSLAPTTAVGLWKGLLESARDEQETYKVCGTWKRERKPDVRPTKQTARRCCRDDAEKAEFRVRTSMENRVHFLVFHCNGLDTSLQFVDPKKLARKNFELTFLESPESYCFLIVPKSTILSFTFAAYFVISSLGPLTQNLVHDHWCTSSHI